MVRFVSHIQSLSGFLLSPITDQCLINEQTPLIMVVIGPLWPITSLGCAPFRRNIFPRNIFPKENVTARKNRKEKEEEEKKRQQGCRFAEMVCLLTFRRLLVPPYCFSSSFIFLALSCFEWVCMHGLPHTSLISPLLASGTQRE